MARGAMFVLFIALSTFSCQHVMAGRHLAAAPGASDLSGGLGPYLQQEAKYSLFNKIVQKLNESTSYDDNTVGWFEGPTNQTLLVVADDNLRKGFTQLAEQYKISNPDTFVDRLIDIADGSTGSPTSSSPTFSKANWAAIALIAFANSHTLPAPYYFYGNQTILNVGSAVGAPDLINVTTSLTGIFPYTGNLQVYNNYSAPALSHILLRQEGGLQHASDGLTVPGDTVLRAEAPGSVTLFVYELDGIFLYGQTFGPADVTGYSGDAALKYFAQNGI